MNKHYSNKKITSVGKNILEILIENESKGLSLNEILEEVKEEKELVLTSLNELFNYNACVVLKNEKYYFEA